MRGRINPTRNNPEPIDNTVAPKSLIEGPSVSDTAQMHLLMQFPFCKPLHLDRQRKGRRLEIFSPFYRSGKLKLIEGERF